MTKSQWRDQLKAARAAQPEKDSVSESILERALSLDQFLAARTVLFYIDVRDEVRTRFMIEPLLSQHSHILQRIGVPYCVGDHLHLCELRDWSELEVGAFGILEPTAAVRAMPERRIAPAEVDLVFVPGVGFDRTGGRLGHGNGYYDRLLQRVRSDCLRIGLAYVCQVVDSLPLEQHDQRMDLIVTEYEVIGVTTSE